MSKIDYKKQLKELYTGKKGVFNIIEIPKNKYLQIHGSGNPNTNPSYKAAVEALYTIAYSAKFICKKSEQDFVVMPLEGLWYADDNDLFHCREKDKWKWTMLIMMPPFVTEYIFKEAVDTAKKKKDNAKIDEVFFREYDEGLAVQTLHVGSYDAETPVIASMHEYVLQQGYKLTGLHHEIYLSNPNTVAAEKLKTIIRQPIAR
ncbi:MAG: GyrI-like domain-containing protein [Bacillota bacterium]|nr:GyrI-like domain-containing protein [Bacillota bacterium]